MMGSRYQLTGKTSESILAVVARCENLVRRVEVEGHDKDGKDPVRIHCRERKSGGGEDPFSSSTLQSVRAVSLQIS
jgi:hypothetical protein